MHVSFHSPEFAEVCVAITAPRAASNPLALQDHWPRKVACALLVFQPTYGDDSGTVLGAFCTGSSGRFAEGIRSLWHKEQRELTWRLCPLIQDHVAAGGGLWPQALSLTAGSAQGFAWKASRERPSPPNLVLRQCAGPAGQAPGPQAASAVHSWPPRPGTRPRGLC